MNWMSWVIWVQIFELGHPSQHLNAISVGNAQRMAQEGRGRTSSSETAACLCTIVFTHLYICIYIYSVYLQCICICIYTYVYIFWVHIHKNKICIHAVAQTFQDCGKKSSETWTSMLLNGFFQNKRSPMPDLTQSISLSHRVFGCFAYDAKTQIDCHYTKQ